MWRDRTNLYISYRSSYSHRPAKRPRFTDHASDEDRVGLLSPSDDPDSHTIEMSLLPPAWTTIQDEVTSTLSAIAAKSALLDKLHAKHVLPGFDDNRASEEAEIERLTMEITAGFHRCQGAIMRMERMGTGEGGEGKMRRNARMALAARVQEVSGGFRKKQGVYLKKLRSLNGMGDRVPSPLPGASFAAEEDDVSYSQSMLQRQATVTQASNDTAIAQREREITDIAKGIIELADIFKELQTMVIDQGTLLDRIDYNVEQMSVSVKEADKELKVATNYQARYTKRKIILLLILIIAGIIILLTLKPSRSSTPPPPPPSPPVSDPQPPLPKDPNPLPKVPAEGAKADTPDPPSLPAPWMMVRRREAYGQE